MERLKKWARLLDCFQYCSKCLRALGHAMVLLVCAMVALTWWTVVAVYGPMLVHHGGRGGDRLKAAGAGVVVVLFSVAVAMILWSYFAAVLTDPGRVPEDWHPFLDEQHARHELERMATAEYYVDRRDPRRPRYCKRCQQWKPERAHHCSVLGRCVLRMDHYCIWLVNTVGLKNYKFFLLFMLYTCLTCMAATLLLVEPFIAFFKDRLQGVSALLVFLAVVLNGSFAIALTGFLVMHATLIRANCTTIEMYEKDRLHPWPFNRGLRKNLLEVFGHSKALWLLPVHSEEDWRAMEESCFHSSLLAASVSA